jgi:hypothetical protein
MKKILRSTALAVGLALAFAVAAPTLPATAANPNAGTWTTFSEWSYVGDDCSDGATCTGSSTATRDGRHTTASSLSRPDPALVGAERFYAGATGAAVYKVPRGTKSVTATMEWIVESGQATASSSTAEGVAYARADVRALASGCGSCVFERASEQGALIVAASGTFPVPESSNAAAGAKLTDTVTITGPNGGPIPSGTWLVLRGYTVSYAVISPVHDAVAVAGLAGEAAVSAATKLRSISVTTTAA